MAACTQITYEFEELPLIREGNERGGFVNGKAAISSYDFDSFEIKTIWLDGVELPKARTEFWNNVHAVLIDEHSDDIFEQIAMEEGSVGARMAYARRSAA